MTDKVAQIKQWLPSLSVDDLRQIEHMAFKNRIQKGQEHIATEEQLFYGTLSEVLEFKLHSKIQPLEFYAKDKKKYARLQEVVYLVNDWIEQAFGDLSRIDKRRVYALAIDVVVEWVEEGPIPLSPQTVLNNFSYLPGIIDKKFPGYLQNNLMPMILNASRFTED